MHNSPAGLPYDRSPTLMRLLDETDLELKLVAGTSERAERAMNGIHLTEILDPERWLAEGWVMMTTGVLLERKPDVQRTLVRDLDRINATALGYCVGVVTKNVPSALLDEARRLDLPLFVMPLHIKARDVATRANRMILANDDTVFQQSLSTQDVFFERFESVTDPDWLPEEQLVENLASLLGLPVSFRGSDTGAAARDDPIGQALRAAPTHAPITKRVRGNDLLIVPARVGALFVGWMVVSLPVDFDEGRAAMKATAAVARLVALAVLSRKRAVTNLRAVRQELMGQVLGLARQSQTSAELVRRLGQEGVLSALHELGFRPGEPVRGILVEGDDSAALETVIATLHDQDAPFVFVERDRTLNIMAQLPVERVVAAVEHGDRLVAGVGGESDGVGRIARSLEQARAALDSAPDAQRLGPDSVGSPRCLVFDELPLSSWMLHHDRNGSPAAKARDVLAPLHSNPAIFDTVVAYFAHGMDVATCAEALFIHPNSVRYRLSRAEQTLRISFQEPAAISDVYLALRALREL